MGEREDDLKQRKLYDIQIMQFDDDLKMISSSLTLLLNLYETNVDTEIADACKQKILQATDQMERLVTYFKCRIN